MIIEEITNIYFREGTRGYNILMNYYQKYNDLFQKTIHAQFNDFSNQILLNVSTINFSKDIDNLEAYIIGTLKIQCRVQLDKALKYKNRIKIVQLEKNDDEENENQLQNIPTKNSGPETDLEVKEIFNIIQYFKGTIKASEIQLLNNLIDERSRNEIALNTKVNMNTLDTQIRRLRIKLISFLTDSGFKYEIFEKYKKNK